MRFIHQHPLQRLYNSIKKSHLKWTHEKIIEALRKVTL